MNLYRVTNGTIDEAGEVHMLVLAESGGEAGDVARDQWRRDARMLYGEGGLWKAEMIDVQLLREDTGRPWVSEVYS